MELSSVDQHAFTINLLSALAFAIFVFLAKRVAKRFSEFLYRNQNYSNRSFILAAWLCWITSNVLYGLVIGLPGPTFFGLATFIIVCVFLWKHMNQFSDSGLLRLDQSVAKGLNYEAALSLCTNQLDFLGIGASKLTSSPHFEEAITRCNRRDTPIRFLLTSPENPLLIDAAKQKNVSPEEYKKRVRGSLEKLAHLRTDRSMNIEVRFYPSSMSRDLPLFRMMFINDELCLLSYNVIGEGDGSQLPQLHLKNFQHTRNVESFYYPFRIYFEKLWADSTPWDYAIPIK